MDAVMPDEVMPDKGVADKGFAYKGITDKGSTDMLSGPEQVCRRMTASVITINASLIKASLICGPELVCIPSPSHYGYGQG